MQNISGCQENFMRLFYISQQTALFVCTLTFCAGIMHASDNVIDKYETIKRYGEENKPYQDIVVNGETIYRGQNSHYCEKRYEILQNILGNTYFSTLKRSNPDSQSPALPAAKVLDLGAATGYFSFRLAYDFGFTCLMVENGQSATQYGTDSLTFLRELGRLNDQTDTLIFEEKITRETLEKLIRTTQPDIILALSLVHALDDCKACIDVLADSNALVIIELPDPDNGDLSHVAHADKLADMHNYIIKKGGHAMAHTERFYKNQTSTFYLLKKERDNLSPQNNPEPWDYMETVMPASFMYINNML